jgi:hypothetical protein
MHKAWFTLLICFVFLLTACQKASGGIPCPFGPDNLASSPDDVTFMIDNQACTTICQVFLGAPSCDDWGITLLGEEVIPHGTSYSFPIPPGTYDLLVVECSEDSYQITGLDLSKSQSWIYGIEGLEAGEACPASLTVVNQTSTPVCNMWIAGPQSESFGYNWLGSDVIPAGSSMTFALLPGTYDVKAEDCDFGQMRLDLGMAITDHQTWVVIP